MTNVERNLYERLLKAKEKTIELLKERIELMEKQGAMPMPLTPVFIPSPIGVPVGPCLNGKLHTYPFIWHGITPPPCSVCGAPQAGLLDTIVVTLDKDASPTNNVVTLVPKDMKNGSYTG